MGFDLHGQRAAGVLLHLSSLPGPHGIGDFGPDAYRFVDWLASAGQTWWQLLPVQIPDRLGSPYASCSAFAGYEGLLAPPVAALKQGSAQGHPMEACVAISGA